MQESNEQMCVCVKEPSVGATMFCSEQLSKKWTLFLVQRNNFVVATVNTEHFTMFCYCCGWLLIVVLHIHTSPGISLCYFFLFLLWHVVGVYGWVGLWSSSSLTSLSVSFSIPFHSNRVVQINFFFLKREKEKNCFYLFLLIKK